jgi:hypothetical protein
MKNTAVNSLEYAGVVTLSQYINKTKVFTQRIHNAGGNSLFNFITTCLLGDFDEAASYLPTKIRLLKTTKDTEGNSSIAGVSDFIYILTKPEKVISISDNITGPTGTVRYSFSIPREFLEDATFNSIGLYSDYAQEVSDYAAFCEIDTSTTGMLSSTVLVIDWELTFSNSEKKEIN